MYIILCRHVTFTHTRHTVISWITPGRGSIAGGTVVKIYGGGFATDAYSSYNLVYIGNIPCQVNWYVQTCVSVLLLRTWILVRQEVHTLSIGSRHACAFRTGPGPNHCPTSFQTNNHFVLLKYQSEDDCMVESTFLQVHGFPILHGMPDCSTSQCTRRNLLQFSAVSAHQRWSPPLITPCIQIRLELHTPGKPIFDPSIHVH